MVRDERAPYGGHMSDYRRPRVPGACIFFTVALQQRGATLLVDHIETLRDAVRATRRERSFGIDAWVVMPDHLHCIWRLPEGDADYSLRWRLIKARFSRSLPKGSLRQSHIDRRERGIWQRRFWEHHVRNDQDWRTLVTYCWMNPVKHGFVEKPGDWPFSSYRP